jgi:hypothetical protein
MFNRNRPWPDFKCLPFPEKLEHVAFMRLVQDIFMVEIGRGLDLAGAKIFDLGFVEALISFATPRANVRNGTHFNAAEDSSESAAAKNFQLDGFCRATSNSQSAHGGKLSIVREVLHFVRVRASSKSIAPFFRFHRTPVAYSSDARKIVKFNHEAAEIFDLDKVRHCCIRRLADVSLVVFLPQLIPSVFAGLCRRKAGVGS